MIYRGWGEHWPLGMLADDAGRVMFEYSAEAIRRQLELSPLHLRLRHEGYANGPHFFAEIPGLIADALPDGWGLSLMDRAFRRAGRDPATLSPLDRLAFVGERAIGALTFEPADTNELTAHDVALLELARQIGQLTTGANAKVLRELILIGGSPHGARPKALARHGAVDEEADAPDLGGWLLRESAKWCERQWRYKHHRRSEGAGTDGPDNFSACNHSITLIARIMIVPGSVIPSAFAVFRLTVKSNKVGCSIGISPALAPLKILSTK